MESTNAVKELTKAVVLLSGGQDSTTCLFYAKEQYDEVHAVGIEYGQKHVAELTAAAEIAKLANVPFEVHSVEALASLADSTLVGGRGQGYGDLPPSYVPGRNLIFLTIAAAKAAKIGAKCVVGGMCQTDYSGYPDCRREFIDAMEWAIKLGFPCSIRIITPLMWLTKAKTVQLAQLLPGAMEALALSVTCYEGLRPGCGVCPACVLRARGFDEAGVMDPCQ